MSVIGQPFAVRQILSSMADIVRSVFEDRMRVRQLDVATRCMIMDSMGLTLNRGRWAWLCAGVFLLPWCLCLPAWSQTSDIQGNPLVPDTIADPSIVCFDGTYYLYATTDTDKGLSEAGPPVVWVSKDFLNWSFDGILIPSVKWGKIRYWAPGKVVEKEGKYYLFVTVVPEKGPAKGYVATAEKPEGPFVFVGGPPVFQDDPATGRKALTPLLPDIDGEPFIDDDGSAYIFWRKRQAAKLAPDFLSIEGRPLTIKTKRQGYSEGPFMFKRNGIYYYVYTLSGSENYKNAYMMSKASPLGPFEAPARDDIITFSDPTAGIIGPGHGNVFHFPGTDDFVFVYLEYGRGGTTRQVYADRMAFNDDGTIQPVHLTHRGIGPVGDIAQPVNLALAGTATASSERKPWEKDLNIDADPNDRPTKVKVHLSRTFDAKNAIDGSNGTCWWADDKDASPSWQLDLGATKSVSRCEMAFVEPTLGHAWTLEKSSDGKTWEVCGEQKEIAIRSPHVVENIGETRYLRVTIHAGKAGLWEFRVY
jgi:Glycosyl hydrolases family 43/F5/8 type C domain